MRFRYLVLAGLVVGALIALAVVLADRNTDRRADADLDRVVHGIALRARTACLERRSLAAGSNRQAETLRDLTAAVKLIGRGARDARLDSYERDRRPEDLAAFRTYARALELVASVDFGDVPRPVCPSVAELERRFLAGKPVG